MPITVALIYGFFFYILFGEVSSSGGCWCIEYEVFVEKRPLAVDKRE